MEPCCICGTLAGDDFGLFLPSGWSLPICGGCAQILDEADTLPPGEKLLTKKLLVSCRGCSHCRLPQMHFICPETCPKGLANGPCGAVGLDGTCEFGSSECIHSRRMRLAEDLNDFASLEECLIDPVRGE